MAEFLQAAHAEFRVIAVDAGEAIPEKLDGITGLVFMGGSMSVNDPLPWIGEELALIRQADKLGIPVLGHCLGAQLLAKALGAEVVANPVTEIGWFPIQRSQQAKTASWLDELPEDFMVYHWHGETFHLPDGAVRILENAHCRNQGFIFNDHIGLQCHVEMTESMVEEWLRRFGAELETSATVQSPEQMREGLSQRVAALRPIAEVVYRAWLEKLNNRVA